MVSACTCMTVLALGPRRPERVSRAWPESLDLPSGYGALGKSSPHPGPQFPPGCKEATTTANPSTAGWSPTCHSGLLEYERVSPLSQK